MTEAASIEKRVGLHYNASGRSALCGSNTWATKPFPIRQDRYRTEKVRLDETLHRIRAGRNIQTPIITCPRCGMTGHAAEPRVSVRALILALARFEVASRDQTRTLEKEWAAYRKQHRLDVEGKALAEVAETYRH